MQDLWWGLDNSRDCIIYFLEQAILFNKKVCFKKEAVWVENRLCMRGVSHPETVKCRIKIAHKGGKKALEILIKGLLSDNETANGYLFDKETYSMVEEICSRQDSKKEPAETIQYFKDEYAYSLITCEMLLTAGVGFFTVDKKKIVLRREDNYVKDQINITEALAALLNYSPALIRSKTQKARNDNRIWVEKHNKKYPEEKIEPYPLKQSFHKQDDPNFIEPLKKLFQIHRKRSEIKNFNFPTKNIDPSPRGIITYLIETIIKKSQKEDRPSVEYFKRKQESLRPSRKTISNKSS